MPAKEEMSPDLANGVHLSLLIAASGFAEKTRTGTDGQEKMFKSARSHQRSAHSVRYTKEMASDRMAGTDRTGGER